ncbi:hypothetical protein WPS_20950 [Vulcanimicrobium alpinum]|uniref:Uncharacterized protein n=2 Tax=Vulcanimicrobium alpinum TaxID=3016050 RepID=A0AAN1XXM4_UNVUL|nr:hypothetical protein WPS_20950 [Vulcanimicrobium alpinum]
MLFRGKDKNWSFGIMPDRPTGGSAGDDDAQGGAASRKLNSILADLDAGDPRSGQERRMENIPVEEERRSGSDRRESEATEAVAAAPVATVTPLPTPAPQPVAAAVAPPDPPGRPQLTVVPPPEITPTSDEFAEAQRRAAEHRAAIQAMLDNARAVEERLAAEAAEARSAREKLGVDAKLAVVSSLLDEEKKAAVAAREIAQRTGRLAAEHAKATEDSVVLHAAMDAANALVEDLKRKLDDARRAFTESEARLAEGEQRLDRAAEALNATKAEAAEAARRFTECRAAREAAEADARAAQERAKSIGPSSSALEVLKSLESVVRTPVSPNGAAVNE